MTFKKGDRVVKAKRYSKNKYCKYGGEKIRFPLKTAGIISKIGSDDEIHVDFDNGIDDWRLDKSELELESVYKLRRCRMIDTKKLKIGKIIKVDREGKIGLFEIAGEYDENDETVKCHGISNIDRQDEQDLERLRKDYPDGNWSIELKNIMQILSNFKTIGVGDDVVVKRHRRKNWHHSGDTKDGSMGKVEEVINDGDDYRINIDGNTLVFHKNEVMKSSTEFPKYATIYDGNYEVSTWGIDLPLMKKEAEESIKKTSDKKAVIYELKPLVKMQATIKIQNIGKKQKRGR